MGRIARKAMSNGTPFGLWVRERCRAAGLTQEELAGQVGCSLVTLHKIENGERRPSRQLALLLADYFRVPADEREAFVTFARTGTYGADGSARAAGPTPWRAAHLRHTNLPAMLTGLLGREQEESALCELLAQPRLRLLTLAGPPGIGKTSLALQVASMMADRFDDGVYMIELAPVREPELVITTIARTLGLRETASEPVGEALFRHLGDKRMLLLLDNFEQVLDAAPFVVTLLHRSPWVKALVTSREALHINGERHFPVSPLALPDPGSSNDPMALRRNPCVQLLMEHTQAIDPVFALTGSNAGDIAAICAGLDGLPLALQLAASAVAVSPQQARNALGHRLGLLKEGARDLPARHRTLRQAIEWSYDLLDGEEQAIFRRLGVFVAGFTPAAAGAVSSGKGSQAATDSRPPTPDPLALIPGLVSKNLLRRVAGTDGEPRLGMLETIREYALEQLAAHGEEAEVRERHARYYLSVAQEAAPHLAGGGEQAAWLERLATEHENYREALAWLLNGEGAWAEPGRVELAAQLCTALYPFWQVRGYISEARSWYKRVAESIARLVEQSAGRDGGVPRAGAARKISFDLPVLWGRVLSGVGIMAWNQTDYEEARNFHEQSLALRREIGDKPGIAASLHNLGTVTMYQGDFAAARRYFTESLAIARELNEKLRVCASLSSLGITECEAGNFGVARSLEEESLQIAYELENTEETARALNNLAIIATYQGDFSGAHKRLEEALRLQEELGHKSGVAYTVINIGFLLREDGRYAEARSRFLEGLNTVWTLGDKRIIAECLEGLAGIAGLFGEPSISAGAAEPAKPPNEWKAGAAEAAKLYGAAEALREVAKAPLAPAERGRYERYLQAARARLDEAAWNAAWAEGRAMGIDKAVAYALGGLVKRKT